MHRRLALPTLLVLLPALASAGDAPTSRENFLKHCAQCHGETGDGNGVQKLEKPARSFKDGGFSYGNTPEALLRTLTFGIPGTPMPSFSAAMTRPELEALAAYVITLGPEVVEVKASDTRLVVKDMPLFARGKLPPIVDGAKETVRGLLVGTPDGFTFEYDVEDVRLLGVRQGDFLERRDWSGRGGDALLPLGKLVYDANARAGTTAFSWSSDASAASVPVHCSLFGTVARGGRASVFTRLRREPGAGGSPAGLVEERVSAAQSAVGAGFVGSFRVDVQAVDGSTRGRLEFAAARSRGARLAGRGDGWCVRALADGRIELSRVVAIAGRAELASEADTVLVRLPVGPVEPQEPIEFSVTTLLLPAWNVDVEAAWKQELAR